jgi:phage N-6-adenine-methyltransferase
MRAEKRVGELLAETAESGERHDGKGQPREVLQSHGATVSKPTLEDMGISKTQSSRWQKFAALPKDEQEAKIAAAAKKAVSAIDGTTLRGATGTGENEWHTPAKYIELARGMLGNIDLDPASSEAAQRVVMANNFLTLADDGLKFEWNGKVWLNPPYAQPAIAQFVSKMVHEVTAGRVSAAIMLTHNYTDTVWCQEAALNADAICFTRGRVKFEGPNGEIAAPTQGQAFFYFGHDVPRFVSCFAAVGFVVGRLR